MKFKLILIALVTFATFISAEESTSPDYLDVLHGDAFRESHTYGTRVSKYGRLNIGPSLSIVELWRYPYLMNKRQLVAISSNFDYALAAFNFSDMTSFVKYEDNDGTTGIGIATNNFGLDFSMALDNEIKTTEEKSPYYKVTENERLYTDLFALTFSVPFQKIDFTTKFSFTSTKSKYASHTYADADGKQKDVKDIDNYVFRGEVTFTNRPSAKDLFWDFGLSVIRPYAYSDSTHTDSENRDNNRKRTETTIEFPRFDIAPFFGLNAVVLRTANSRVQLGAISLLEVMVGDKRKDKINKLEDFNLGTWLEINPTIAVEHAFNEHWMIWYRATMNWTLEYKYELYTEFVGTTEEKENSFSNFETETRYLINNVGIRFSYANFSIEGTIASDMFSNPFRGFDDDRMTTNVTAMYVF